jgi:CYTH domain-containing protein
MEIERKYLILKLPEDLSGYRTKRIEQAYLCHNPTVRIRKSNDDYILTYKSKRKPAKEDGSNALIHHEVELELTEEAYLELKAKTDGGIIYKTRYLIPLEDGLTAELDLFEGKLQGLIIVEVEFPDEETADKFVPPAWFGKELSSDKRFSNYHLSGISDIKELEIEKSI